MGLKDNWEKVDEVCPNCKQVTKKQKGITRQNIKKLLIPKFTVDEFLITFMLIMFIVLALVYMNETKVTRDWLNDMAKTDLVGCKEVCEMKCSMLFEGNVTRINNSDQYKFNLSKINFTEE